MQIGKTDLYCGAFLSYLLKYSVSPTLFEEKEKGRVYEFSNNKDDYRVYVKYSTKPIERKTTQKWDFSFTRDEIFYLENDFFTTKKIVLLVLICKTKTGKLNFATIPYNDALKCIGDDKKYNKHYRISVKHKKNSCNLSCYGTYISDKDAITIKKDPKDYFKLK